jgi:hypothetical protein
MKFVKLVLKLYEIYLFSPQYLYLLIYKSCD